MEGNPLYISRKPNLECPVRSANEWFEREGLKDWPMPVASEGELDLSNVAENPKTANELLADLKRHAPLEINILDHLLEDVISLEQKISQCASFVLDTTQEINENQSERSQEDTSSYTAHRKSASRRGEKPDSFISSRQRSVELTTFPGFDPYELTPLPGSLEAPQLLNRVTGIQSIHKSFKKAWKKHFLSETSVAIFQDTFWWWFLEKFQRHPESQACLFDRIADSFVGLFLSVPENDKDMFFKTFADCLAQSVYAAFCECFPMTFKSFDDNFKSDLLNLVSEWTTGVKPSPNSWQKWDLNSLETDQVKSLQEDRTHQLKSSLSFDAETFLKAEQPDLITDNQATFTNASQLDIKQIKRESHQAGPGPTYEKVLFHLHGRSPLISHFLAANKLQFEQPAAVKKNIARTEIAKLPSPFATYQEIIQERKKCSRFASKNYTAMMERSAEERRLIDWPKERMMNSIRKCEEQPVTKQPGVQVSHDNNTEDFLERNEREISGDTFKESTMTFELSDQEDTWQNYS